MRRKGISPLIATVLIIGFTVALAAVIMIWGQSFSKSIQESTEQSTKTQLVCSQDVAFKLQSACYCANKIYLVVKNNGNAEIKKYVARFFGNDNTAESVTVENSVAPFAISTHQVAVSGADFAQQVKRIELIPSIEVSGREVACQNNIESSDVELSQCSPSVTGGIACIGGGGLSFGGQSGDGGLFGELANNF